MPAGWRPSSCTTSDLRLLRASTISLYNDTLSRASKALSSHLCFFVSFCVFASCNLAFARPGLSCPEIQRHASFRQAPTSTSHYSPIGALRSGRPSNLVTSSLHRPRSVLEQLQGCRQDTVPFTTNGAPPLSLRLPGGHPLLAFQAPSSRARSALVLSTRAPQPFDSLSVSLLDTASFPTRARSETILFTLFCMVRELQRLTHGFQPSRRSTLRLRQHILEAR